MTNGKRVTVLEWKEDTGLGHHRAVSISTPGSGGGQHRASKKELRTKTNMHIPFLGPCVIWIPALLGKGDTWSSSLPYFPAYIMHARAREGEDTGQGVSPASDQGCHVQVPQTGGPKQQKLSDTEFTF